MENKTHWKKLTNPNYLGAYAFQPGEEKTVTIKEVKRGPVQNQNGVEECTIAYFEEDVKPLILNKTNAKAIEKVWGTGYIEDWKGLRITLKVKKVKAFGEMVDAVRVSTERPPSEAIICEECGAVIDARIAEISQKRFGRKLCIDCGRKEVNNG